MGHRGEKVWLQKTTQNLFERLGVPVRSCSESAQPPGWPALDFPPVQEGWRCTPPGVSFWWLPLRGTGGSLWDPTSVDA